MYGWKLFRDSAGGLTVPDNFANVDGGIPKLKFGFNVKFEYRDASYASSHVGTDKLMTNMFAVKTAFRPNISVDYKTVNYYGARVHVATKTDYGTASITFYDDNHNRAHDILANYIKASSPISSNGVDSTNQGNFEHNTQGPLLDERGAIRFISLIHDYKNGGTSKKKIYKYMNPKFVSINFQDVSAEESAPTLVEITFNYEGVEIIDG